jgi:hypothetical protein
MTGVAFLPMVVGIAITAQLSNVVLMPRLGPRPLIPLGMLITAASLLWLTRLGIHSSYLTEIVGPTVTMGFGIGLIFAPGYNTATLGVANHDAGVASALVNTAQQIGGSIGIALLNTLAAAAAANFLIGRTATRLNLELAGVHSYTSAFAYSAWIFVGGAVLTGLLLRSGAPEPSEGETLVMTH